MAGCASYTGGSWVGISAATRFGPGRQEDLPLRMDGVDVVRAAQ